MKSPVSFYHVCTGLLMQKAAEDYQGNFAQKVINLVSTMHVMGQDTECYGFYLNYNKAANF